MTSQVTCEVTCEVGSLFWFVSFTCFIKILIPGIIPRFVELVNKAVPFSHLKGIVTGKLIRFSLQRWNIQLHTGNEHIRIRYFSLVLFIDENPEKRIAVNLAGELEEMLSCG